MDLKHSTYLETRNSCLCQHIFERQVIYFKRKHFLRWAVKVILSDRTYIIAEAGVNHNGSLQMALQLIEAAATAKANAIKFQSFTAEKLVVSQAPKTHYQLSRTPPSESQEEMLKKLELPEDAIAYLKEHAQKLGLDFFSSLFDLDSVNLAERLEFPWLKIPSGEITNAPLLVKAARTGKPIILSTGMSTLWEIEMALSALAFGYVKSPDSPSLKAFEKAYASMLGQEMLKRNVTLLHCTSEYPAPFEDVNLRAMDTLRGNFGLSVGYSDHTSGIFVSIAAAARGARIIEKHFTIDRRLPGPDHQASLEPHELGELVKSIRQVEKALGSPVKKSVPSEMGNRPIVRKSLVAAKDICKGEKFTKENVTCKRPGEGISPFYYWEWLEKSAEKDYHKDEVIEK
jgi:N-acetylneuraminate synthase